MQFRMGEAFYDFYKLGLGFRVQDLGLGFKVHDLGLGLRV